MVDKKRIGIIYTRVSTDEQRTAQQLDRCEAKAKEEGIEVIKVFDEYESGGERFRPQFSAMVRMLQTRRIDAVIVYSLSRIARDVILWNDFYKVMVERRTELYSVAEPFLSCQRMESYPIAQLFAWLADSERQNIKRNTTNAIRRIRKVELDDNGSAKRDDKGRIVQDDRGRIWGKGFKRIGINFRDRENRTVKNCMIRLAQVSDEHLAKCRDEGILVNECGKQSLRRLNRATYYRYLHRRDEARAWCEARGIAWKDEQAAEAAQEQVEAE